MPKSGGKGGSRGGGGKKGGGEKTSKRIATIASKGLKDPGSLTDAEIRKLAGTALTQAPDKK